jgi:hypothetical protein
MKNEIRPFQSIESSLEFMILLESVIEEATAELHQTGSPVVDKRQREGITLALYKIQQLSEHVRKSQRILNDLNLIRNLLMGQSQPAPTTSTSLLKLRQSLSGESASLCTRGRIP